MSKRTWSELGIDTRRRTKGEFKTICPNCSHTRKNPKEPCLSVDMENERYNCHNGCGFQGYLDTDPKTWKDRVPRSKEHKVYVAPQPVPPPLPFADLPLEIASFWRTRCISEQAIIDMGVTYEDGAIKFPYYLGGELINVKYRRSGKQFTQESGARLIMWNIDRCLTADIVVITEGEMDALAIYTVGEPHVMSVPNGASAGELPYLQSVEHILTKPNIIVVLAVDSDEAGRMLEAELARRIGKEKCYRVRWPEDCKDANDVLMKHGAETLSMCIAEATPYPVPGIVDIEPLRIDFMDSYDLEDDKGFSTGFADLDKGYTIVPGQLTTVTGIPSSGKSEFVDAIAVNTAKLHDWRWAMFSPENYPPKWHMQKWAEKIVGKPFKSRYYGYDRMTRQEAAEAFEWASQYLSILYPEEPTIDALLELVKIDQYRRGTKAFVIDPWNEVQHDHGDKTETNYIGDMLGKIRRFGRDNDMAPFVVPHPRIIRKEKGDDSTYVVPEPYDISASANWYNKSDNILTVARDKSNNANPVRVYVQKIRWKWVGQLGIAELKYDIPTGRYFSQRWISPGDEA